ncbi:S26 family signal peptidase [Cryptosporangium arvum]|uniref:Mitochondrial inner membrane protease subunit 2 n=1 Tax=Cryptosporangium arvum DSM 44712 TaxID=927661 RepID=A0A011A009_9ACTN|nr:S26 family signal peptidase [Cryptosporangium arvum]EXG82802.1 signal peptidase I [Cryptosporangium arvum DSM 44712]
MRAVLTGVAVAGAAAGAGWWVLRRGFVVVAVSGESMLPTFRPGDRVLVRRRPLHRVRRGQVVVLAPPAELRALPGNPPWLIKRAVALPGDPLPAGVGTPAGHRGDRVPPGRFVVLGDNAGHSYDSRRAGAFPAGSLLGVVLRVVRH